MKTNPIVSPIRKKNRFEVQSTTNKNQNDNNALNNNDEKSEKVAIIPIVLPRINSPTLKGNFNTKKINPFDETNNFTGINNNMVSTKNIHRTSLKAYK